MKSKPPELWTPETVTARDLVTDSAITVLVSCDGCRTNREMNIWKVGARLADDYLYRLRFRCCTCGMYPTTMEIGRRNSSRGEKLFKIALRPAAWDEGHDEAQRLAIERANRKWSNLQR
ncbi:hypothetical protein RM53_05090 [Brevundimonas nasdae]|uniref:Uncharacterized protein n=1 Tax=Brevundimonas nasdae TaxID=172043 RepID=A0A0B4CZH0_9CAUL|nr:hypothetical protein [Brevundimonas nasdae]KIC59776.1 hypothetical protein RM53_05090 [Brevundimonas nasdae]